MISPAAVILSQHAAIGSSLTEVHFTSSAIDNPPGRPPYA